MVVPKYLDNIQQTTIPLDSKALPNLLRGEEIMAGVVLKIEVVR